MTSRTRIIVLALLAATALSAVAAGSASANWFVGGSEEKSSEALATLAARNQTLHLHAFTVPLTQILCPGPVHFLGSRVLAREIHYDFLRLSCSTTTPVTGCNLEGAGGATTASIETVPLAGTAVLGPKAPEDRLVLSPETGKLIANIPFSEANTCALAGTVPLKGSFTLSLPEGQSEEAEQTFIALGSVENNSLELGAGNKAFFEGGELLELLENHSKWSFR